ncbi:hypothetical protein IC582_014061 [Cucumis melo]
MKSEFEMSMVGELSCFLGLQIKQKSEGIFVPQEKYAKNIIKKFGLEQSCHKRTPVATHVKADPRTSHLDTVRRILKYVHGTSDFGIMYSYDTTSTLVGCCDVDWAGSSDDRKSTSGGCFFLGNNFIFWFSKKQNCVSLSTDKAEYIAAGSARTQLIWMKNMLHEYGFTQDITTLYYDNMSVIDISKKSDST